MPGWRANGRKEAELLQVVDNQSTSHWIKANVALYLIQTLPVPTGRPEMAARISIAKSKEHNMSTSCAIGLVMPDGIVQAIRCHYDGYPANVGAILNEAYLTGRKCWP